MPELIISKNGKNVPSVSKVQSALASLGATGAGVPREDDGKIKCTYTTLQATKAQVAKALGGTEMDWEIDLVDLCPALGTSGVFSPVQCVGAEPGGDNRRGGEQPL